MNLEKEKQKCQEAINRIKEAFPNLTIGNDFEKTFKDCLLIRRLVKKAFSKKSKVFIEPIPYPVQDENYT